jgi:hypothetical protein
MMTDNELRKLAQFIVEEQAANPEWMLQFANAQQKLQKGKTQSHWINSETAADILGISRRTMRDIKGHFTFIKSGDERQSNIYFDANKLREEYNCYLASRNKKVVKLNYPKVAAGL